MFKKTIIFILFLLVSLGVKAGGNGPDLAGNKDASSWLKKRSVSFTERELTGNDLDSYVSLLQLLSEGDTFSYAVLVDKSQINKKRTIKPFSNPESIHNWIISGSSPFNDVQFSEKLAILRISDGSSLMSFDQDIPYFVISSPKASKLPELFTEVTGWSVKLTPSATEFVKKRTNKIGTPFVFYFKKSKASKEELINALAVKLGLKTLSTENGYTLDILESEEIEKAINDMLYKAENESHILSEDGYLFMSYFPKQLASILIDGDTTKMRGGYKRTLYHYSGWHDIDLNIDDMFEQQKTCLEKIMLSKGRVNYEDKRCTTDLITLIDYLRLSASKESKKKIVSLMKLIESMSEENRELPASEFSHYYLLLYQSLLQLSPSETEDRMTLNEYIYEAGQRVVTQLNALSQKDKRRYSITLESFQAEDNDVLQLLRPGPLFDSSDIWIAVGNEEQTECYFSGIHLYQGSPHIFESSDENFWIGWGTPWLEQQKAPSVTRELTFEMISRDSDGDKLTDLIEIHAGTNPHKKDTDGDGIPDNRDTLPLVNDTLKSNDKADILQSVLFSIFEPFSSLQFNDYNIQLPVFHVMLDFQFTGSIKLPFGWVFVDETKMPEETIGREFLAANPRSIPMKARYDRTCYLKDLRFEDGMAKAKIALPPSSKATIGYKEIRLVKKNGSWIFLQIFKNSEWKVLVP